MGQSRFYRAPIVLSAAMAVLLPALQSGCNYADSDGELGTPFRKGYGYTVFYNNQDSPSGRPAATKAINFGTLEIDAKGRYIIAGSEKNPSGGIEMFYVRYLPNGALDTSFGNGTAYVLPNFNQPSLAGAVSASTKSEQGVSRISWDSSNNYYVNFYSSTATASNYGAMKLTESGSLVTSFGTNGYFFTSPPGSPLGGGTTYELSGMVYRQDINRLIAAGYTTNSTGHYEAMVARYTTSGALDTSFGSSGGYSLFLHDGNSVTGAPNANKYDFMKGVPIIDESGYIYDVFAQSVDWDGSTTGYRVSTIFRALSNGAFDTSYGPYGTGAAEIPRRGLTGIMGSPFATKFDVSAGSAVLGPNGTMFLPGQTGESGVQPVHADVWKWNSSGYLDSSFGTGGIAIFNNGGAAVSGLGSAATKWESFSHGVYDPITGKVVATGWSGITGSYRIVVARFNMNGTLDASFGGGAGYKVLAPPDRPSQSFAGNTSGTYMETCSRITMDRLGRYVLTCRSQNASSVFEPVIIRLLSNGDFNS